jgi:hypothetical protein
MPSPTPQPEPVLGASNFNPVPVDPADPGPSYGRRPDPALDVSTRPGHSHQIPGFRPHDKLDQKLQTEGPQAPPTEWRVEPIRTLDPTDIIATARHEGAKILTPENQPYRTEAARLEDGRGWLNKTELARPLCFPLAVWGGSALMLAGTVATAGSAMVTGIIFASDLSGGSFVGSPALAFSAVTSALIATVTWLGSYHGVKALKNWFNNRIEKPIANAKAADLAPDKMEWVGTFLVNLDRMNPVLPFFRRQSSSLSDFGDQYSIPVWKGIARDAAVYAHNKCPRFFDLRFEDVQAAARDMQFDQKLDRNAGGQKHLMAKFIEQLQNRWLSTPERFKAPAELVSPISVVVSAAAIPTIITHAAKFPGAYPNFLWSAGELALKFVGF